MSNRIEETNIPAGARIRIGAPAERPQAAIDALIKLFSEKQNVISARLGLMEILHPDGNSEFTYTIGIQCSSDEQATIQQAVEVLQSAPAGRWPISIFPPTDQSISPKTQSCSLAVQPNAGVGLLVCFTGIKVEPLEKSCERRCGCRFCIRRLCWNGVERSDWVAACSRTVRNAYGFPLSFL